MTVLANLGEDKVIALQMHGKLVKCTEKVFMYSKYQHVSAQKQVTYFLCSLFTQCNLQSARMLSASFKSLCFLL